MSFNIKQENIDKENSHVALASKENLRSKTSENAVLPQKRPLVSKTASEKRIRRVPLGGKDQNMVQNFPFATLQRSQSSIPQKLPYRAPQLPTSWQPTLGRSNSSLGFSHSKSALNSGRTNEPGVTQPPKHAEKTNPHKNNLLSADNAARSKTLVPRFSADSLEKPVAKVLHPVSALQLLAAPQLHASNLPTPQRTNEPSKKRVMEIDDVIELLAEDENSIETVPERREPLQDVPDGISPLSGQKFRFLEPELREKKLLAENFDCSMEMSLDEIIDERSIRMDERGTKIDERGIKIDDRSIRIDDRSIRMDDRESTRIDAEEGEMAAELEQTGPLGLSEQELNDLLDY